jgi:hypothetical protein
VTDSNTLPGARARLVNPDGTTRREFYDFFRRLEQGTTEPAEPVAPTQPGITGAISPLGLVGENVTLQQISQGTGGELVGATVDQFGRVSATRPVVAGAGVTIDGTTDPDQIEISVAGLSNPMTALGDLIRADTGGVPERLAIGTNGQVLTVVSGEPEWATNTALSNPMTTAGDLITGGVSGAPQRLAVGTDGQVLTVVSGAPSWGAGGGGADQFYNPGAATYVDLRPIANSGTWTALGTAPPAGTGNGSAPTINTTNKATRLFRVRYTSPTATTTSICGIRSTDARFFLGTTTTKAFDFRGGWMMSVNTSVSTHRVFYGLRNDSAPTDVNPSTLTNMLGFGYDAADTNVQFFHNDASGTATKVSTGIAKPATDNSAAFMVRISSPGGATVNYEITEIVSGATFSGTATTDLPAATQDMRMNHYASVGGTSSTIGCDFFAFGARWDT